MQKIKPLQTCCLVTLVLISFCDLIPIFTNAFNIDQEYPIIITNKFNGENAHFGASVILLPKSPSIASQSENHETDITGWVIVGAPKANSTNANHSEIYEPGLVWRCSLGPVASNRKLCEIVEMDPTGDYDPKDWTLPYKDRKDGGWLGGSMFVGDSDRFVTCASRWINQKYTDLYLLNGICYWMPKSHLTEEKTNFGWPWLPPKLSYRLSPLLTKGEQYYKIKPNPQQDRNIIYVWAFGQFGFSLHITPKNELISGGVGVLDWAGSIVYYRDSIRPQPNLRRYNAHAGSPAFTEVLVIKTQNHSDILQNADYFGYSVTSGNFFRSDISANKTQFVSGAPRASFLSGKVLVFTVEEVEGGRSEGMLNLIVDPIEGKDTTKGKHYGSYFGHTLLATDGNGDGFDDLFVGAPLYGTSVKYKRNAVLDNPIGEEKVEEDEKKSKMKSGDEGCVFVYWSTGEDFKRTPQALCGDKIPGSRFGFSISALKDINYDGFNDVAIGAPYENEGRGAVYIYHGGKNFMALAQKLLPEIVDKTIMSFGWSLSLGIDIDKNGYPDLAVGAYETNQVIIYRTIPIIHFTATLTSSIPKLLPTTQDFNFTSCISYNGHGQMPTELAIKVKLTVEVETEGKRLISLSHDHSIPNNLGYVNNILQSPKGEPLLVLSSKEKLLVFRSDREVCYNFTAYRIGILDGLTQNISVRKDYWINGYDREPEPAKPLHYEIVGERSPRSIYPVSTVKLNSSKSDFNDFVKNTHPLPAGNTFSTEKLIFPVGTLCEADGDPECLANLTINAFLVDYTSRKIFGKNNPYVLGSTEMLTLTVELSNSREVAMHPINLDIRWTQPPKVRRLPPNCDKTGNNVYSCSIRRSIKESQREVFTIELDMTNVYGQELDKILEIDLSATTNSKLVAECNHKLSIPLRTQVQPRNFSHMGSKVEYITGNVSIPTFGIFQAFEIGLNGSSTAAAVKVDFDIPYKISVRGKIHDFLTIRRPIVTYDGGFRCFPINGSFIDDTIPFSTFGAPETGSELDKLDHFIDEDEFNNKNSFYVDDEDDSPILNDVSQILLGKVRRLKRAILDFNENDISSDSDPGLFRISCKNPSSRNKLICMRISCIFSHFTPQKKSVIEFKLKIYNAATSILLIDENSVRLDDVSSLWIETTGTVRTLDELGSAFGPEGKVNFISRLGIPPPYEIPAWILIISVAGGLLILSILILILKKCGFFRRSKRDEMLYRRAMELRMKIEQRNRAGTSTSSTALLRSSSSKSQSSISGTRKSQRKRSFRNPKASLDSSASGSTIGSQISLTAQKSSISPMGSPSTIAKQREMPGAVDLTELRRLYAVADNDDLY